MERPSVLAMVMAGGEGKRLHPLTAERSKPAVPFGGRYRIVDFVLSNLINSGMDSIYLLVQYKSQSLIEHVRKAWASTSITNRHFITVVPPQMRASRSWFQGTADAVYQNLNLIHRLQPDIVAVFGADHIYRMDLRQMLAFHQAHEADATVAALPAPLESCRSFGVIEVDRSERITGFQEKPSVPTPLPGQPTHCYASMGNYLFNTNTLITALEAANERLETDFGADLLPRLAETHRVFAYNFAENYIPGLKPYEEKGYWRDVGDIDAYYRAHMDMLGPEPRFDDFNIAWPIYSGRHLAPVARVISGDVHNSLLAGGTLINGARVHNSIIRREVVLEPGAEVTDSVIMDYTVVGSGARIHGAIIDRYNMIPPGTQIGIDPAQDRAQYHVSDGGIVVLPAGQRYLKYVY